MRGTRVSRSSHYRKQRFRLFAALFIAAAIFGLSAIQLSEGSILGGRGATEVAAAALDPPSGDVKPAEPAATPALEVPASLPRPVKPVPESESAPTPPNAATEPQPSLSPQSNTAGTGGKDTRKLIALTFDDGPDAKYTPQVLDILKERGVKGTFFLVGTQTKKYPKVAARILNEGHSIGNHSWSHKDLKTMTAKQIASDIDNTQQAIADATGFAPQLMRAPYGNLSPALLNAIHEREMKHVYWTIDTRDWAGTSLADMRKNVSAHAQPGAIILMHSFGGKKNALENTLKLLPLIIEDLQKKGFTLVTVDELIDSGQSRKSVIK